MSQDGPATRMELLRVKAKRKLAEKGHRLLKRKRDALIREFFELAGKYKKLRTQTLSRLQGAYDTLTVAQAVSGSNRVRGLAYAAQPAFILDVGRRNIMGVRVPTVVAKEQKGGFNASVIGTSYHVQDARDAFCLVVVDLAKLAETEQALYSLADEIQKTKRRVNALENVQIPRLDGQVKMIKERLAETEREAFTRLKHVKAMIEAEDEA